MSRDLANGNTLLAKLLNGLQNPCPKICIAVIDIQSLVSPNQQAKLSDNAQAIRPDPDGRLQHCSPM